MGLLFYAGLLCGSEVDRRAAGEGLAWSSGVWRGSGVISRDLVGFSGIPLWFDGIWGVVEEEDPPSRPE